MPAEQRGSTYRTKAGWGLRWYDENGRRRFRSGFGSKRLRSRTSAKRSHPGSGSAPPRSDARRVRRALPRRPCRRGRSAHHPDPPRAAHASACGIRRSLARRSRAQRPRYRRLAGDPPEGYRPKILGAFAQVLDRAVAWKLIRENPVRLARTGKRRVPSVARSTRSLARRLTGSRLSSAPCTARWLFSPPRRDCDPEKLAALEQRDIDHDAASPSFVVSSPAGA